MTGPPPQEPLPQLVRRALEALGYRVAFVAPELLRAEPAGGSAEARGQARLVACDPVWLARTPGVLLAAPGSDGARRLWQAVAERGRTAVWWGARPGQTRVLRRALWFRFLLEVSGFALPEGSRRSVIDVLAEGEPERARLLAPEEAAGWAVPAGPWVRPAGPGGLGWVSAYEVRRLGRLAARRAVEAARERVKAVRETLRPVEQAERQRLARYFDERQAEETAVLARLVHRAVAAGLYARLAAEADLARDLQARAGRLARMARLEQEACAARLEALERERAAALAEVEDRFRLTARLEPAGLAVVWLPAG